MQVGQGAGGLQALRSSINEAVGNKQTDHRIVELSLAGAEPQKLALESPTAKPSGWSHFVGSLRSLAGEDPMTKLTSAITREYGASVGAEIARTLRGRELTVGLASQALLMAERLDGEARAEATSRFETRLAASFIAASQGTQEGGQPASFWPAAPPQQTQELLTRIAAGPGDIGKLSRLQQDEAIRTAVRLFTMLRDAPGMSEPEATQLLKFAASSKDNAHAPRVLEYLLQPIGTGNRGALGDQGIVPGSSLGDYVPATFNARATSTRGDWNPDIVDGKALSIDGDETAASILDLHAQMVNAAQLPQHSDSLAEIPAKDGKVFQISKNVLTDGHRLDAVVQGEVLDRKRKELVPVAIRSALPPGEKGDAMCLLAGKLMPQEMANAQYFHVLGNAFTPREREKSDLNRTLYVRPDGMMVVRGTQTLTIKSVEDSSAFEGAKELQTPARFLQRQEFLVAPGAPGQAPHIVSISTDVLFN